MIISEYNELFDNEGKKYVYNMSSKALLEIDEQTEAFLKEEVKEIEEDLLKILYENGIVVKSHEFELERLINNMNNVRYDSHRLGIFLSLTPSCNLNCIYCYQDARKDLNKSNQFLTQENWGEIYCYLQKAIEEKSLDSITIFLFGGEPMLNSSLLEQYIKDMRTLDTKVIIVLITNGTLFHKDNIDFYCRNIDSVQITMDGMKDTHDKMKPHKNGQGSFEIILKNLRLLIQHNVQELMLRINLNQDTLPSIYKFVDFLCEEGLNENITAVKFAPVFFTQNELKGGIVSDEKGLSPEKLGDLYLYSARRGLKTYKDLDGGLCIGKMQSGLTIDERLNVYSCPGILYQEPSGILENGNIKIDDENWYEFLNNDSQCIRSCKYAPICFGGCKWSKECNKKLFGAAFKKILQAYIISFYN